MNLALFVALAGYIWLWSSATGWLVRHADRANTKGLVVWGLIECRVDLDGDVGSGMRDCHVHVEEVVKANRRWVPHIGRVATTLTWRIPWPLCSPRVTMWPPVDLLLLNSIDVETCLFEAVPIVQFDVINLYAHLRVFDWNLTRPLNIMVGAQPVVAAQDPAVRATRHGG